MSYRYLGTSVLGIILLLGNIGCSSSPRSSESISKQSVQSHVETLSSDEMRGRHALDRGADKAADYIAHSFRDAGLEPLSSEQDYFQEFELHQFEKSSVNIRVDGSVINDDQVIVIGGENKISWNIDTPEQILHVGKDDEVGQALSRVMQSNETMVISIDPVHTDLFHRYKRYLSRMNFTIGTEEKVPKVLVLHDEKIKDELSVDIEMDSQSHTLKNVVASIPGKREDEFIVYSAHYDHIGILKPVKGDSIANGADDNASGTVGVIELANYFSQQPKPERTLLFAAFTGEEMGMLGSKYFSKSVNPDEIVAMINMEMIGKPSRFGAKSAFITGFDESDLGQILQRETENFDFKFHPDPYTEQNLFYRSDNATLARMGVPAHTISTDQIDIDTLYHTVDDEIFSIDFDHLTQTIRGIARGTQPLVDGKATPKRVDPQRLN